MSSARTDHTGLVIGGEPRIDFLPPEVKAGKQARKVRRTLIGVMVIAVAACAAGYVFATTLTVQAEVRLQEEQARTQELLAAQAEFAEVRSVTSDLGAVAGARRVGSASEILWSEYLAALQATLPAGTVIETFTVDSQTALESAPIADVPLQSSRVATINFTAQMPDLGTGDALLVNLRDLRGFADATIRNISNEEGVFRANVVLNVNAEAFEKRFFETTDTDTSTDAENDDQADGEN